MVMTYSELYLQTRSSLMAAEDQQTASHLARNLLCFVSGKSHEALIADRDKMATEEI